MTIRVADLVAFIDRTRHAVEASVSADGAPQAAVIGVAVTPELELVFDTLTTTRKCGNLRRDRRIALVIHDDASTIQLEGAVDEPAGDELAALKARYFTKFPDGRDRELLPDCTYFRVRPTWVRWSDFRGAEPVIVELSAAELGAP